MGVETVLIGLILVCGFYVAWNIGANDVANAMGTSVGSGALTLRRAVILAALFEFAGAFIVGSNVSETVRKGMFDPTKLIGEYGPHAPYILACGMLAALLAAGTWLLIATWMHWPVSTTHSIVGAVVGFGCLALGFEGVNWSKVGLISAGWVVSPLISGTIAYVLFGILLRTVFFKRDPVAAAKRVAPWLAAVTMFVMTGMTAYKGLGPLWGRLGYDDESPLFMLAVLGVACLLGLISLWVTRGLLKNFKRVAASGSNPVLDAEVSRSLSKALKHLQRVRNNASGEIQDKTARLLSQVEEIQDVSLTQVKTHTDSAELQQVEKIFVVLQVLTACLVAFAHGANDVANAIGPLSAAYQAVSEGAIQVKSVTPVWALFLGGAGIVIGLATWGWKVIKTVGEKITELTPSRGFCAEFAASITILLASVLPIGLPISTTHTLVGAVLGVGLARGINALNLRTMRDIVAGWAITIPAGAVLSMLFYFVLKMIFVDSGWIDSLIETKAV
jgi:phosphate/sulfate permease